MKTIFVNQTANATSQSHKRQWFITSKVIPFATQTVYVWGTFDGANVQLQVSPDGVEWFTPLNATFSAKAVTNINVSAYYVRGIVSNAGASTSVNLVVL